jgi:hypothetical protein
MLKGYQVMAGYENLILGHAIPGQGEDGIRTNDSRMTPRVKVDRARTVESELKHDAIADMTDSATYKVSCSIAP